MAAEYEVNEIGYIGSIWGGNFSQPKIVGRTIQVINVPNAIEGTFGGANEVSVFFTNKDDIDINSFNKQFPDSPSGKKSYDIKRLKFSQIEEISKKTKVSSDYLSGLTVLYLKNPRQFDDLLPIQDQNGWGSFEILSNTDARYLFSADTQYITKYVFLVSEQDLNLLKEYFLTVKSQETIFDPVVIANPTTYISDRKAPPPIVNPSVINFGKTNVTLVGGSTTNDEIIEIVKTVPFEKPPFYNDIQEDMRMMVAEEQATEEFFRLLQSSPEQFYISPSEGDAEYERLSQLIRQSLLEISKRYVDGWETGGETPPPPIQDEVIVSDDGSFLIIDGAV